MPRLIGTLFHSFLIESKHACFLLLIRIGATSFVRRRLFETIRRLEKKKSPNWDLNLSYEMLARSYEREKDFEKSDSVTEAIARHPFLSGSALSAHVRAGLRYADLGEPVRAAEQLQLAESALSGSDLPDNDRQFIDVLKRKLETMRLAQ
jgi:hypothetical protein